MVKIRLARSGAKKRPVYRIVATDIRSPRDGRFIEQIGLYDPRREHIGFRIDSERYQHWIASGAKPSATLASLYRRFGKSQDSSTN